MFQSLIRILLENGRGVHAYRKASDTALHHASIEPQNAASWYMLSALAVAFLERNERMPIVIGTQEAAFEKFSHHANAFNAAQTPSDVLKAINDAATELSVDALRTA